MRRVLDSAKPIIGDVPTHPSHEIAVNAAPPKVSTSS